MKFIKSYKIFESKDLSLNKQLAKFGISKYILNTDGSIDCNHQHLQLFANHLYTIPFNFNRINGDFSIYSNYLTSLKNCPKYISGYFECFDNKLSSLEFGPEYVGNFYACSYNKLETLKGCVEEVYGHFDCVDNQLTSLEFCPMQVEGDFGCSFNKLEYLDRSPFIKKDLICLGMFDKEPEFNGHCEKLVWE